MSTSLESAKRPAVKVFVATTVMLSFISFWRAAAIVLSDLASSAYYVGGDAEKVIGKSAPWFILDAVRQWRARALYRIEQHVRARRRLPSGQRSAGGKPGEDIGFCFAVRLCADRTNQRGFRRPLHGRTD